MPPLEGAPRRLSFARGGTLTGSAETSAIIFSNHKKQITMNLELAGKNAIFTGASRGIGKSIALKLAEKWALGIDESAKPVFL